MTARGYEFYLRVFNSSERSERVRYRVEHERIKFISTSGHVIFCLLYKHGLNSCEKGAIYLLSTTTLQLSKLDMQIES